jgi:hypothetical protein
MLKVDDVPLKIERWIKGDIATVVVTLTAARSTGRSRSRIWCLCLQHAPVIHTAAPVIHTAAPVIDTAANHVVLELNVIELVGLEPDAAEQQRVAVAAVEGRSSTVMAAPSNRRLS